MHWISWDKINILQTNKHNKWFDYKGLTSELLFTLSNAKCNMEQC
jgi:hypothetical protein